VLAVFSAARELPRLREISGVGCAWGSVTRRIAVSPWFVGCSIVSRRDEPAGPRCDEAPLVNDVLPHVTCASGMSLRIHHREALPGAEQKNGPKKFMRIDWGDSDFVTMGQPGREVGMRRRDFITLLGGTAVAWPLAARAQQPASSVVGFLADGTPEGFAPRVAAFRRGLSDTGFIDGQNIAIELRWARRNYDLLPALAGDLVRRQVSVIATAGSEKVTRAAKEATTTIPIVATVAGDPVKRGLVASINHPGGNLTVISLFTSSSNALVAKRVEITHELVPKVATVGWLVDANILDYDDQLHDLQSAAQALGLELATARVGQDSELEAAFASLIREGAGALIETGPVFYDNRERVVTLAARAKVPVMYEWRTFVNEGGLMSYGSDIDAVFRQAGIYAGRVLKGENVGDLPVVQQSKIELIVNLRTAKALGLTFPITLLGRADEVIE
jgi:putative tryptophan/tyrosine transport system substrate-binding protein